MIHFVFSPNDKRYLFLKYDEPYEYDILKLMCSSINLVDPVCYQKNFRGQQYTQDFIWEYRQRSGTIIFYAARGMWQPIYKYLKRNEIPFDGLDQQYFKYQPLHTFEEFKKIVDSWGLKYTPRPYQYECAYKILQWNQSLSSLATRAGKTLLAYIVFRYAMEYYGVKKILMICPGIDLVKQGYEDFKEYKEFFKTECVWSGGKLVESANLTIGTFQSLIQFLDKKNKKYNPAFFNDYDLVFVDEVHRANAKSIKDLISQPFMETIKVAFGMTGTLPEEGSIERFCLHSLLGAKIQHISPKELMDAGYISKLQIYQHRLKYKNTDKLLDNWIKCTEYSLSEFITVPNKKNPQKKDRVPLENPEFLIACKKEFPYALGQAKLAIMSQGTKSMKERKYEYAHLLESAVESSTAANFSHIEMMTIHFMEERIDYLIEVLRGCPNNTLVLAQHVEYIKHIGERLKQAFPDRHIVTVWGGSKERKSVKDTLKQHNDCILIAGYSIMGTGITLSNLCYGVLFESFKSNNINMQSIGRGLGLSDMKEKYILHDITDTIEIGKLYKRKKLFLQGLERCKIYQREEYPYKVIQNEI